MTHGPANKISHRLKGTKPACMAAGGDRHRWWLLTLLLATLFLIPDFATRSVHAQAFELPPAADPARFEQPEFDDDDEGDFELDFSVSVPEGCTAPAGSEDEEIDFEDLTLVGNSVMETGSLEHFWRDLRGETITMEQLYEVCANVSREYQNAGWMLSWALFPAQDVEDGVFTLRVIEGFISEVVIENSEDSEKEVRAKRALMKLFEPILHFRPTRIDILERYLLLANDLAGVNVQSVLRPSADVQGATRLTLQATEQSLSGNYAINNRGSKFAGPVTHSLNTNINSAFGLGEKISIGLTASSKPRELAFLGLGTNVPIGNEGNRLVGALTYSKSQPGFTLDDLNIKSTSKSATIAFTHPYKRTVDESIRFDVDFTISDAKTLLGTGALVSHDKTRRLNFGVEWTKPDFLGGNMSILDGNLRLPIHAFGASDPDTDTVSRADANPWAPSLSLKATHIRDIGGDFSLTATGSMQLATGALFSGDEFGVGGQAFGRAFDASEITGDYGLAGALVVSHNIPLGDLLPEDLPEEWKTITSWSEYLTGYGFLDWGRVWNYKTSGDAADNSLASTGLGMRTLAPGGVSLNAELARPLLKGLKNENNEKKLKGYLGMTVTF